MLLSSIIKQTNNQLESTDNNESQSLRSRINRILKQGQIHMKQGTSELFDQKQQQKSSLTSQLSDRFNPSFESHNQNLNQTELNIEKDEDNYENGSLNVPQITEVYSEKLENLQQPGNTEPDLNQTLKETWKPYNYGKSRKELSSQTLERRLDNEKKQLIRQRAHSNLPTNNKITLNNLEQIINNKNQCNIIENQSNQLIREQSEEAIQQPFQPERIQEEIRNLFETDHQLLNQLIQNCSRRMMLQRELDYFQELENIKIENRNNINQTKVEKENKDTSQMYQNILKEKQFNNNGLKNIKNGAQNYFISTKKIYE